MNSVTLRQVHIPEPGHALLAAARRLAIRLDDALHRPAHRGMRPGETDAEFRRRFGRDVPASLRRDLGLDPDVL